MQWIVSVWLYERARALCLGSLFSRLPLVLITFCFDAHLVIRLFFVSSLFVESFSGLAGDFVLNYICPTVPSFNFSLIPQIIDSRKDVRVADFLTLGVSKIQKMLSSVNQMKQ